MLNTIIIMHSKTLNVQLTVNRSLQQDTKFSSDNELIPKLVLIYCSLYAERN